MPELLRQVAGQLRRGDLSGIPRGLVAPALATGAVLFVLSVAALVRILGSQAYLLVVEPESDGDWHLLEPGEQPSFENQVALDDSFTPARRFGDGEAPTGTSADGDHLIGTLSDDGGTTLIALDVSNGEITTLYHSSSDLDVELNGDRIQVVEEGTSTARCHVTSTDADRIELVAGGTCGFDRTGRFAAASDRGEVSVVTVDGGGQITSVPGGDFSFAPDGGHIAVSDGTTVSIVSLDSGETVASAESPLSARYATWNRGDAVLLSGDGSNRADLLDTGGDATTLDGVLDAAFADPDGTDLLLTDLENGVELLSSSAEAPTHLLDDAELIPLADRDHPGRVEYLLHARDDLAMVVDGELRLLADLDHDTTSVSAVRDGSGAILVLAESADDGATLYRIDGDEVTELLDERATEGQLVADDHGVSVLLLDADGAQLFLVDGDEVTAVDRADGLSALVSVDGHLHYSRFDGYDASIRRIDDLDEPSSLSLDGYLLVAGR